MRNSGYMMYVQINMKKMICIMLYYSLSNSLGLRTLQVYYEKLTTDNLVKHGFPSTIDVYLMHGSNGVFLPRECSRTIF